MPQNIQRCDWCLVDDAYICYHDNEWGRILQDDNALFASLCLECLQSGLSWHTILKKRAALFCAFDGFCAKTIAAYDDAKINALLQNKDIIRHRGKILAIRQNAHAYLQIKQHTSFFNYLWQHIHFTQIINHPNTTNDIASFSPQSIALAKSLKQDGFKFVGKTNCYAFMQAVGMINDHINSCAFKFLS